MPTADSPPVAPPEAPGAERRAWAIPSARSAWSGAVMGLLVLLALLPLIAAAAGSLAGPDAAGKYLQWWGTSRGWEALGRTMQLALLASALAVGLAWALLVSVVRWSRRLALPAALLSCLPILVPSSALATAWLAAMGPQGPLGEVLPALSAGVYSLPAAAAVLALRYFGIAVAVLMYQQQRQLGRGPAERVFRIPPLAAAIRLRLEPSARATAAAGLIVMLFCMNDHIIPGMLLVSTYGPQVMIQYSALLDPAAAAALAVPMAGVCTAMVALGLLVGRAGWTRTEQTPAEHGPAGPGWRRLVAAVFTLLILGAALATPIIVLAERAGRWQALADAIWDARRQLWQTLYYAAVAGPLCAALGAALAGHWIRCRRARRPSAVPLVLLNLTVPATLLAIGVIELTQLRPLRPLRNTSWPLIAAYVVRFLPVATLAFYAAWRNDPPLPESAAKAHGLGAWRTARHVAWPRRRASLLAVALLCGLLIATELEMSILLAVPGAATLGIRLYTLIHTAPDSIVSALTLGILALVAPWIVLSVLLLTRRCGRRGANE